MDNWDMKSVVLKDGTKQFEPICVKLALALPKGQLEKYIAGQLIRCAPLPTA